jgi:hypothetical protein
MSVPDDAAGAPNGGKPHQWAVAGEIAIAAFLAVLGVWHIWKVKDPDAWTGFALIGLALLFYMMRGQIITKLSFSKGGFEAELKEKVLAAEQRAEAAENKADAAVEKANFAKVVVTQYTGPPPARDIAPEGAEDGKRDKKPLRGGNWTHPDFERKPPPKNDPQKHQWGGQAMRNDRLLDADYLR